MDRIDDLLDKTSRTFALSIPLLPEPTRRELGVAYLLFRIADTFEDAAHWETQLRVGALSRLIELLEHPDPSRADELGAEWAAALPIEHEGYLDLLRDTGVVVRAYLELDPEARAAIAGHTTRTIRGMVGFVERAESGVLRLRDLDDLRAYCYAVAGIVGELSTDLFLLGRASLAPAAEGLRQRSARFGEALQLVNILKDASFDRGEGRCYLPEAIERDQIFALAREDLVLATEYTTLLQEHGAPRGVVAFCALPVRLAWGSLDVVERLGPGSKITRDRVFEIIQEMNDALDGGRPAAEIPARAARS